MNPDEEEEDEEQMEDDGDVGLQGGGQQIVNITSGDNSGQQPKQ